MAKVKELPQVNISTSIGPVTGEYLSISPDQMEGIIILTTHPTGDPQDDPQVVGEIQTQMASLFPKATHIWITSRIDMKVTHIDPDLISNGSEYMIGISGDQDCVDVLKEEMQKNSKFADSVTIYKAK
jgi:hypothetical protein